MAGRGEVDDREAAVTQADRAVEEIPLIIRSAMVQHAGHSDNGFAIGNTLRIAVVEYASYAAHKNFISLIRNRLLELIVEKHRSISIYEQIRKKEERAIGNRPSASTRRKVYVPRFRKEITDGETYQNPRN